MATWRMSLHPYTVRRIDFAPSLVLLWRQPQHVTFHDAQNGASRGDLALKPPAEREGAAWRTFLDTLKTPNGSPLPYARVAGGSIAASDDGRMRLCWLAGALTLEVGGKPSALAVDAPIAAVDLDRALGLVAALDAGGRLHLFQQQLHIRTLDTGIVPTEEFAPDVQVARGGAAVCVTNGREIAVFDAAGKAKARLTLHYPSTSVAYASDGKALAVGDLETGVLRVYDADLKLTHQRFAADLLAEARRVRVGEIAVDDAAIGALALGAKGALAFALGSMVCLSNMNKMGVATPKSTS